MNDSKRIKRSQLVLLLLCMSVNWVFAQTETFSYTGAVQTYTVPDGVTLVEIETWGAQGGSSVGLDGEPATGGLGGYSIGKLFVIPGQILNVYVGGAGAAHGAGGYNGGGQAATEYGAAGGGGSDVRVSPYGLSNRVIVGGGGGGGSFGSYGHIGGNGGGLTGGAGAGGYGFSGGGGGTDLAGGSAGCCYGAASGGVFGSGAGPGDYHNAGGGGGWYGGGSGAGYAAAGGGSSYILGVFDGSTTGGVRNGNGLIVISVACDPLDITASTDELCEGEELTLTAISDNGGSITWDEGALNGTPFIPGATGIITYTAISDNDEDCWRSIDIEVFELPEVNAAVDFTEICFGDGVVFSHSGDADTYLWDPVEVSSGDDYFPEVGLETYTLTGIDAITGCENTSSIEVLVHALPIISAGEDLAICLGSEVVLSGTGLGVDGDYSWDGGVINEVAFEPSITDTYILTGTDANDCENKDTVLVTVYELPVIEAGLSDTVCHGESVVLIGEGLADPDGYAWSDGVINEAPFVPDFTNVYHLLGVDENGCSNIDSVLIVVNDLPIIDAGEDQAICNGASVVLSGDGAGEFGMYEWSGGIFNDIEFIPTESEDYVVTGTDANGCENTDVVTVEVYDLPAIDAGEDLEICIGDEVVLSASGAGIGGTYNWEDGIFNDVAFEPISTETYVVLGIDINGCENMDSVQVTVHELPLIVAGEDIEICAGEETVLNGSGAGVEGTYNWNLGAFDGVPFIPESSGNYILVGVDANGCENLDTLNLTLLSAPEVNGGIDQRLCIESEVVLSVVDKNTELEYSWDNGVEDGVSFIVYNEVQTIYTVTVRNADGCESTDEVWIEVINCDTVLIYPTGFSPNNDGVNDFLVFTGIDYNLQKYLAVYNEWGMKLYESYDYQNDWDGTNYLGTSFEKNTDLPVGTYYYILEYGDNVVKNYVYIER